MTTDIDVNLETLDLRQWNINTFTASERPGYRQRMVARTLIDIHEECRARFVRAFEEDAGRAIIKNCESNSAECRETIVEMPGFTRGIDFFGPLPFIGLSQVRKSAVFSGIPITDRLDERICEVWVVNILTGQTIAFLRLQDAFQEIFAVQILPGIRYPDLINQDDELIGSTYAVPDEAMGDVQHPPKVA